MEIEESLSFEIIRKRRDKYLSGKVSLQLILSQETGQTRRPL